MTTKAKIRTSIELNPGDVARLQDIAKRLGYVQTRGPEAGKSGSISGMLQAIAENKAHIERIEK